MKRIHSLDVLRGLAIFIMVFVDAPPNGIAYPIFVHASWEGLTFADFAFPGFVFTMGVSAAVSMSRRKPSIKKILKRAALLFAVGILFNVIPAVLAWLILDYFTAATFLEAIEHLRFFGILQRLALTYALGMLIVTAILRSSSLFRDINIFKAAFGLLIISSLGFHIYAPDNPFSIDHNISRTIDFIFPGVNHIFEPTHDPEGLYGTIASTASFLFGFFEGRVLTKEKSLVKEKVMVFVAAAITLLIVGCVWNYFDIIAKKLWTAPFALITSGVEILVFAALIYLFDKLPRSEKFFQPLCAVGMNPLFFFLLTNIALVLLYIIPSPVKVMSLYVWTFQSTFYHLISPEFGSAVFCLLWCIIWLPIAEFLYRRNIIIKL